MCGGGGERGDRSYSSGSTRDSTSCLLDLPVDLPVGCKNTAFWGMQVGTGDGSGYLYREFLL